MNKIESQKIRKVYPYLLLSCIAILMTVVFLHHKSSITATGDLPFHLARIKELTNILDSPVSFKVFNANGYGINWFYPYVTVLPAAILFKLVGNIFIAYILFIMGLNVVTACIMYRLGEKIFKSANIAFIFSVFYSFSAYRLTNIYFRADLSESIAMALIPVILFEAYQILFNESKGWIILSVAMSLLIYTHLLSVLITCILLGTMYIYSLFKNDFHENLQTFVFLLKAVLMTVALTAFFWAPFLSQMLYQPINSPTRINLGLLALDKGKLFRGVVFNDLTKYTFGIFGLFGIIIPLFNIFKWKGKQQIVYLISILLFVMTTRLFPWTIFNDTAITQLQFPWRLYEFQTLFSSLSFCFFLEHLKKINLRVVIISTVIMLGISTATAAELFSFFHNDPEHNVTTVSKGDQHFWISQGFDYYRFDFAPKNSLQHTEQINDKIFVVNDKKRKISHTTTDSSFKFSINSMQKNGSVVVPVLIYRGIKVTNNGQDVSKISNDDGRVKIGIKKGLNSITISYPYSILEKVCFAISFGAFVILGLFLIKRYRNKELFKLSDQKN